MQNFLIYQKATKVTNLLHKLLQNKKKLKLQIKLFDFQF